MKLKVMTYNVLYAFHERQGHTMIFQEARAEAVKEVVRAVSPDILGLTEAVYCGLHERIIRPDYQEMFGLKHLYATGYEGEWGGCLLSRYPIVHAERLPLGSGVGRSDGASLVSAIRAELDCEGCRVHIDLVHPSPKVKEAERVKVMTPLLSSVQTPYILLGDFNALSDEDPYEHATLVTQMKDNVEDPEGLAARMLDRQLISAIRSYGLIDTLAPENRTHTLPTPLSRPGATQGAQLRIDYIFASKEFQVKRSEVIKSVAAKRASDHYPVVTVLEYEKNVV